MEKGGRKELQMYVLDSSAIIEVIEKGPNAEKVLRVVGNSPFVTTSICLQEVLTGTTGERDIFIFESLLGQAEILVHDAEAAREGAKIMRSLIKSGSKINIADVFTAGIIQSNNAELVTLDKDFSKIKSLRVKVIE